jgi:hypothetical protein
MSASVLALACPGGAQDALALAAANQPAATSGPVQKVTSKDRLLTTRAVWPVGVPLFVSVNSADFEGPEARRLTVSPGIPGAAPFSKYVYELHGRGCVPVDLTWSDDNDPAGTPSQPCQGVRFTFTLAANDDATAVIRRGETELPITVRGAVDDVVNGVRVPEIDEALRTHLGAWLYRRGLGSGGAARLSLGVNTNCDGNLYAASPGICHDLAQHPGVTLAVRIQIQHDGITVGTCRAWWRGTQYGTTPLEGWLSIDDQAPDWRSLDRNDGKWRLRIVSDPEMALRDFESSRYWLGDVTVPVRVSDASTWEELQKE